MNTMKFSGITQRIGKTIKRNNSSFLSANHKTNRIFGSNSILVVFLEHIGHLVRMSASGYRGRQFERRHQYVVSINKTVYPHCFSRLSCEMSTRWEQPPKSS